MKMRTGTGNATGKRSRIHLFLLFMLTFFFCQNVVLSNIAQADTQTAYPTGDNSATGTWAITGAATRWQAVAEAVADDATSYIAGTAAGNALFNFPAFTVPAGSTITNLTIYYRASKSAAQASNIRASIKVNATNYDTTDTGLNPSASPTFTLYSFAYTTNPNTGAAWTETDINGTGANPLQAFGVNSTDAAPNPYVTQVYAVVTYTLPNGAPSLSISQPDGTSDTVTEGQTFNITYSLSDNEETVTAAFYYDSNNTGLDGTIIPGACVAAAEGSGVTCSWDTTGMTPGAYYVYGIADDGANPAVSAYSAGTITINAMAGAAAILHNSANLTSTKHAADGGWGVAGARYGQFTCDTCHTKGTTNIKRVRTAITTPDTSKGTLPGNGQPIVFSRTSGNPGDPGVMGDDSTTPHATSNKICEICHTYDAAGANGVKVHPYNSAGATINNSSHQNNSKDCTQCHKHSEGFKKAACNSCHGDPPTSAGELANSPYATGSASAGAHNAHVNALGFSDCTNCHNNYIMPQESTAKPGFGDISIGFNNFGSTTGSYSGQSNVSYNNTLGTGTKTCSTNYCHGSTINPVTNPVWDAAAGSYSCGTTPNGSCHAASASNPPLLGNHTRHAGSAAGQLGLACSKCHGATAGASGHVGGEVAWSLDTVDNRIGATAAYRTAATGTTANRAPSAAYGSCSNIYCHSSAQSSTGGAGPIYANQTWGGGALTCSSCHQNMDSSAAATGSHTKHAQGTVNLACATCHNGYTETGVAAATHVDNQINLTFSGTGAGTSYSQGLAGAVQNGYGNCTTSPCHSSGQNATGNLPASYATVTWGATATGCGICHVDFDTSAAATGSHTKHAQGAENMACAFCHGGYTETSYAAATHLNSNINLSFTSYAAGANYSQGASHPVGNGYGNCSNLYCHSTGQSTTGASPATFQTVTWNSGALTCGSCHQNMDSSAAATGSHTKHAQGAENMACAFCHNGYTETTVTAATHVDNNINLSFSSYAAGANYSQGATHAAANGYGNCSNLYCHSTGQSTTGASPATFQTVTWNSGALTCGSCHQNMDSSAAATGSHTKHAQGTVNLACATCHNGYTETGVAAATHVDNQINLTFSGTGAGTSYSQGLAGAVQNGYGNCTTSPCHSSGQNATGNLPASYATVTWGATATGCGICHVDFDTSAAATGSHTKHAQGAENMACAFCHGGYTETSYAAATHLNSNINLSFTSYAAGANYSQGASHPVGNGYGNCSNLYCHSTGQSTTGASPATFQTVTWNSGALTCGSCHQNMDSSAAATGSHTKHAQGAENMACAFCHNGYTETTVTAATHVDNNINLSFSSYAAGANYSQGATHAAANGYGNCSNLYCHSTGQSTTGASPATFQTVTWNSGALTCGSCHQNMDSSAAATGSHTKHAQGAENMACAFCHNGYTETTVTAATHVDNNINLSFSSYAAGANYSQGATHAAANGYGNCSNLYCHSTGQSTTGASPATFQTVTWNSGALTCGSCHQNMDSSAAATGSHTKHAQGTVNLACATCHNGYTETGVAAATHVDNQINLTFSGTGAGTSYSQGLAGAVQNGYGNCTTSPCHSSGQNATGNLPASYATVTWGATATGCGICHVDFDTSAAATGSHTKHAQGSVNLACATCHAGYTETSYAAATHLNGNITLSFSGTAAGTTYSQGLSHPLGDGYGTCSTNYCHSNGKGAYTIPTWGGVSPGCTFCHPTLSGKHSSHVVFTNASIYGNTSPNVSGSAASYDFGCGNCHPMATASHMNGSVDMSLNRLQAIRSRP